MERENKKLDPNKEWMASGKIGCTFAAMFAKNPESIGWYTTTWTTERIEDIINHMPKDMCILSIQFPEDWLCKPDKNSVIEWALSYGCYAERLEDNCVGLRYKNEDVVSWVQYFGPDADVVTRRAPIPELCLCIKRPLKTYAKVGFKGILHLAHASIAGLTDKACDLLWNSSFINTKRRIGHDLTIKQAAKTTYYEWIHKGDEVICIDPMDEDEDLGMSGIVLKGYKGLKKGEKYKVTNVWYRIGDDIDISNEKEVRKNTRIFVDGKGPYLINCFEKV